MELNKVNDNKKTTDSKLLVIAHDSNELLLLEKLLKKLGCDILTAKSGAEGLTILDQNIVEVIISDMSLPKMTGADFFEVVSEKYPNTFRILLTDYGDMKPIDLSKVSQYIEKPWNDVRFTNLVRNAFDVVELKKDNARLISVIKKQNDELKKINETLESTVLERSKKIIQINENLKNNYRLMIDLFSGLLDMRQPKINIETPDMMIIIEKMSSILNLPEKERFILLGAFKMRYLGQVSLPDALLLVPYSKMTKEQKKEYEQYPLIGCTFLTSIPSMRGVADIILQQKEYLNGKGYPNGEWKKYIFPASRVLNVANDYLELLTGRMFEEPLTHIEAIKFLDSRVETEGSEINLDSRIGGYYDKAVVDTLKVALEEHKVYSPVPEQRVWSKQLRPNMILSRDLLDSNGRFLLAKGNLLTEHSIEKLIELEGLAKNEFKYYVIVSDEVEDMK